MSEKIVNVIRQDRVCRLVLNRPGVMNALNMEMIGELQRATNEIASDEEIRVVILEGAGDHFCSGADIRLLNEDRSASDWLYGLRRIGNAICTLREMPQPVITKVRGVAVGGGANLALAGDFVVASDDARFAEVFVNIGLMLDAGGNYFLPRLVGLTKARELALLGEQIDGKTAASMGLIYKSTRPERLDHEVDALAATLSKKSLAAMALIKEGLEKSLDMSLREVLEWEASHQAIMIQRPELKEATREFLKARGKA